MRRALPTIIVFLALLFPSTMTHSAAACEPGGCVYLPLLRATVPAVIVEGQPFLFIQDTNHLLHIVGEVQNTGDTPVAGIAPLLGIKINATILDAHGQVLGTSYSYTALTVLAAHTRTCFDIGWFAHADVGSVQLAKPLYQDTTEAPQQLSITDDTGTYNPTDHAYYTSGKVTNNESTAIRAIYVYVTLYNAAGQAIGCDSTAGYVDLKPGESSSFYTFSNERDYSDVASYKLQAMGIRP